MNRTDLLIDRLVSDATPVRRLNPPIARALAWLGVVALVGALAILLLGDGQALLARYRGSEQMMVFEMAAMLATGVLAVIGAFVAAVPGRSRRWLLAPLAPLTAWLLLSGVGCYRDLVKYGASGMVVGEGIHCLAYIMINSLLFGIPLLWLLSRARPIDPLPVALLGGLGTAALAAFTLQFFHPFAVTLVDLAFHLLAILLVVALAGLLNRRTLSPA